MPGDVVSRVISQAAPTPRISCPKLDRRLADQIRRKVGSLSGSKAAHFRPYASLDSRLRLLLFGASSMAADHAGADLPIDEGQQSIIESIIGITRDHMV